MHRNSKALSVATSLLALMVALAPVHGVAQSTFDRGVNDQSDVNSRPRPQYDPLGLRFGGFDLRPSLEIGVEDNDNLFASETDPQSDLIYTVRPRVELVSHWSRHQLRADFGAERFIHDEFGGEDRTNYDASLNGRLDIRRDTIVGGGVSWAERSEPRSDPDSPNEAESPIEFSERQANAYVQQSFARFRLSAGVLARELDFEDTRTIGGAPLEQDTRDRRENESYLRGEFGLSPRVALFTQATFNERDYRVASPFPSNRDSQGATYLGGVNFDITRLVRGEIGAGRFEQDYDDPTIGTVSGTAVNANVSWFPTMLTTVGFSAGRSAEEAGDATASILLSRASVRVDHELLRNLILTAAHGRDEREYRGIDRRDEVSRTELSGRYLMNRRVTVRAGVVNEDQESRGVNRDRSFDLRRFFVALLLRL